MKIDLLGEATKGEKVEVGACFAFERNGKTCIAVCATVSEGGPTTRHAIVLRPRGTGGFDHPDLDDIKLAFVYSGAAVVASHTLEDIQFQAPNIRTGYLSSRNSEDQRLWVDDNYYIDLTKWHIHKTNAPVPSIWFARWSIVCPQFEKQIEILQFDARALKTG